MLKSLLCADSVQSSEELRDRVVRIAQVLTESHGVTPGTRVLLKAENSAAFITVLLALIHAGASTVLIDPGQRAAETARAAGLAKVRLAVVDDEDTENIPWLPMVSGFELLAAAAARPPTATAFELSAWAGLPDALITWSSGSTGEPKGIVKSGRAMLRNLRRTIDRMGYGPDDVLLPLLPFSHQYGLSLVLISVVAGCSLAVAPYRRLDRSVRMAGRVGATVVDATPSVFHLLLNLVERSPELASDLGRVRMYCTGGAPLPVQVTERFRARFGRPLLDGYGSTEIGNVSFATPANPVACGQVLPGVRVRVATEDGEAAGPNTVGDLWVSTPDRFTGYLGPDGEIVPSGKGWYRTADLALLDEHGNLSVLGRESAVHRSGHTLYPEIIERTAAQCGALVKVVPVPDPQLGHRLVFFVEDAQDRPATYWRERVCAVLPPFEQPNRLLVLAEFPLTGNGKTDWRRLLAIAGDAGPREERAAVRDLSPAM
ncbi:class I adenylate-forming enzyme family protein [Crossiella sp. NPDC003009]